MMVTEFIFTRAESPEAELTILKLSSHAGSPVLGTEEQVKQKGKKRMEKKISRSKAMLNIQIVHE